MDMVFKRCDNCYGDLEEFSHCCNAEAENNKCSYCNKFCRTHPCDECGGDGGYDISVGDAGTVLFDVNKYSNLPKNTINLIKRKGNRSDTYLNYYHIHVYVKRIVDDTKLSVVIGEYGKKEIEIDIEDFYV